MNLEKLSKRVTQELDIALSDLQVSEKEAILEIVQRAMSDASSRTHREMKETAILIWWKLVLDLKLILIYHYIVL